MTFRSEYGEDRWIAENLALPERGVYVDVGCAYPDLSSNTAFLRERGWLGLGIDGNESFAERWSTPFLAAILATAPIVEFIADGMCSRIGAGGERKRAVTLQYVLDGYGFGKLDFLSIDTEGSEFDLIASIDLEKHRPTIIVGEYNTKGIGEDFRLRDYLTARGYRVVHQTVANLIYISE